ncbi:uncharacterized protein LOC135100912 isoform X1 [Scylla paramamosain]|uniref:uncharacterized protein LOC135100912 isoform X1 n=2 Tax=Scylla paramamosain TaxID=85552 RepID=UPI0030837831
MDEGTSQIMHICFHIGDFHVDRGSTCQPSCGGNWRTAVPEPAVDAFPADFYQNSSDTAGQDNHRNTDMHAPDMDMKMEGQESHMMVSDSDASVQEGERQAETRKCPWEKPGVNRANESRIKLSIPVN